MKRKIILSIILALILVGGIFGFIIWRHNNLRNQCKNNLRQLYCPMECCMPLELGLTNEAPLDPKTLATYLKNKKIPKCPCGPEYEIICVIGMVNAKEGENTLIPPKRSFIKSPYTSSWVSRTRTRKIKNLISLTDLNLA